MESRLFQDAIYSQFARIGKALSNPRRLELLDLLSQGPKNVETLARETKLSVANVSQHLQTLLEAHLVQFQKKGTYAIYRLSDPKINRLLLLMQEISEDLLAEVKKLQDEFISNHDSLDSIDITELKSRLDHNDMILIDVRPREEYEFAHIPGAISIPMQELEQHLSRLPRDLKIVAYCRGRYCIYASQAVEWFRSHGLEAVRLNDGVREWQELKETF